MPRARILAVTVVVVAGSACSGDDAGGTDEFSVAAGLAEIPDAVDPRAGAAAVLVDLDEVAETVGVEREPGADVDADPMSPWATVLAWAGGPAASWADEPDLALVAELLDDDERAYAAWVLSPPPDSPDPVTLHELTTSPRAFGVAYSGAGDDQRTTWVYVFADENEAAAAGPEIREILVGVAVEGTGGDRQAARIDEVTTDGRAVIARGASASS